jgi:hypothetical protein
VQPIFEVVLAAKPTRFKRDAAYVFLESNRNRSLSHAELSLARSHTLSDRFEAGPSAALSPTLLILIFMRSGAGKVAGWSPALIIAARAAACFACAEETNPKLSLAVLVNRFVFHRRRRSFSKLIDLRPSCMCSRLSLAPRRDARATNAKIDSALSQERPAGDSRQNCALPLSSSYLQRLVMSTTIFDQHHVFL